VDLGAQVPAGQPLARLESADQRIALDQAQEKFANTRQLVERQRALKTAGVVTQADSERVEFEHREAMLELRKAQRD
jgi:multidrug resistance efflux pump